MRDLVASDRAVLLLTLSFLGVSLRSFSRPLLSLITHLSMLHRVVWTPARCQQLDPYLVSPWCNKNTPFVSFVTPLCLSHESQALFCRPQAFGTCQFHIPMGCFILFCIMGYVCSLSHIWPLEAIVAEHLVDILVRDVARLARKVFLATGDDSSQMLVCHVGLLGILLH